VDAGDGVVGYATFGDFRPFDGYRHTVEHSVYVRRDRRGKGVGKALMAALIGRAREIGKHVMVAAIEADNASSIRLHENLGFVPAGHMTQVGAKFGQWLDLAFMQLTLDARSAPEDNR
jgi:phosphinothricin acetyltransferase